MTTDETFDIAIIGGGINGVGLQPTPAGVACVFA